MKSFFKIAAIGITLTSLTILASQQQKPEDRQFEREQESKNRSAVANATAADQALAQQLHQEEQTALEADCKKEAQIDAQDDEASTAIKKWLIEYGRDKSDKPLNKLAELPLPVLRNIVEFHYGDPQKLKFIAHNMASLLPSTIDTGSRLIYFDTIFHVIDRMHAQMGNKTAGLQANNQWIVFMKWESCPEKGTDLQTVELEKGTYLTQYWGLVYKNNPAFAGFRRPNGILYKIRPEDLDSLKNLSIEQLHFLANLDYKRKIALIEWGKSAPRELTQTDINNMHDAEILTLSQAEIAIHNSLPVGIREIVEKNYRLKHLLDESGEEQQ